ncbi:hypothetical protein [Mucilaginibacter sp. L3T2-6]|uniref:hypothetical protein n=1 Tax=Mucilaginibacter sp. L3T2-6 TaxID=3062491 RepID=UPI0026762EB2|nr:hypothetical protein [Mucilaginibacter sp. L3T2-6]MDO3641347.1 hypothetical protein [Mucilaginibacter sp. L3T2-6]MDV6213892.1 hypothetical protein [Mucilaginibacter sp. L3T2-6]
MTTSEVAKVYETVLSIPGMNEGVKIDVKINRKAVLLLHSVVGNGLNAKEGETAELLKLLPEETVKELKDFNDECLKKAGLIELSEKLKALHGK